MRRLLDAGRVHQVEGGLVLLMVVRVLVARAKAGGVLVCGSGGMEIGHILPVLPRHTHLTSLSAES